MATKSRRHTHKYCRRPVGYQKVWACALPDCNHHMPPHYAALIEGKASICWECEQPMLLDAINMEMDKPICPDCRGLREFNAAS